MATNWPTLNSDGFAKIEMTDLGRQFLKCNVIAEVA